MNQSYLAILNFVLSIELIFNQNNSMSLFTAIYYSFTPCGINNFCDIIQN